jgi:acetyltransferase
VATILSVGLTGKRGLSAHCLSSAHPELVEGLLVLCWWSQEPFDRLRVSGVESLNWFGTYLTMHNMSIAIDVARLDAAAQTMQPQLIELLADAVNNGASVGFLRPLDQERATHYWQGVFTDINAGSRVLLVAKTGDKIIGTVQLDLSHKQNGSHRAEVQKLLVLSSYRRQGVASQLMRAIEREAKALGRWLVVLDTELECAADRLYRSLNWIECGSIPSFALSTDGAPTANVIFYKSLRYM